MGQAKMPMQLVTKEKSRKRTFEKRKKSLLKKASELSILCDVPVCVIIFDPFDNTTEPKTKTFPPQSADVRKIIEKFKVTKQKQGSVSKRSLTLSDLVSGRIKKVKNEIEKKRDQDQNKNKTIVKSDDRDEFPMWDKRIDSFTVDQILQLLFQLTNKIEAVKKYIDFYMKFNPNFQQEYNKFDFDFSSSSSYRQMVMPFPLTYSSETMPFEMNQHELVWNGSFPSMLQYGAVMGYSTVQQHQYMDYTPSLQGVPHLNQLEYSPNDMQLTPFYPSGRSGSTFQQDVKYEFYDKNGMSLKNYQKAPSTYY